MFWRARISEGWGSGYLKSVGGNKKQVVEPSFLRNFQTQVQQSVPLLGFASDISLPLVDYQTVSFDNAFDC